jgi:hypothetical protein
MRDMAKIERVVTETIARDFDNVRIVNVRVYEDVDSGDDEVLRIDVVFEGTPKDIDARKLSGMVRRIRPKLIELGEFAFPLFSFISKADAGSLKLASA